jgi:hypothetical protein
MHCKKWLLYVAFAFFSVLAPAERRMTSLLLVRVLIEDNAGVNYGNSFQHVEFSLNLNLSRTFTLSITAE